MNNAQTIPIRNRIIGLLVRRVRSREGKSPEECASQLGCSVEAFSRCEQGLEGFSLPQLEALAYLLGVPIDRLWDSPVPADGQAAGSLPLSEMMRLRSKILAIKLRQWRRAAGLSQQEIGRLLEHPADMVLQYEEGEREIPLAELEVVASRCGKTMADLTEEAMIPTGLGERERRDQARLKALPSDLREFVLDPANGPCLRIAMWLGSLAADDLHRIATTITDAAR